MGYHFQDIDRPDPYGDCRAFLDSDRVRIGAAGKTVKSGITLPRHRLHKESFEFEVRDGALNISFWNDANAFNSIGLSSLRVRKVRDLPRRWQHKANGVVLRQFQAGELLFPMRVW